MFFYQKNFQKRQIFTTCSPSSTDNVEVVNTIFQQRHNDTKKRTTVKVFRGTKKMKFTLQEEDLVVHSLVLGHIFESNFSNEHEVMLRKKGPQKPMFPLEFFRILSLTM